MPAEHASGATGCLPLIVLGTPHAASDRRDWTDRLCNCHDLRVSDYAIEIWKRDFEQPLTVVLSGNVGEANARQRFEGLRESIEQGRAKGEPMQYITWFDVVGEPKGFTVEPANTIRIRLIGQSIDVDQRFD